MKHRLSTRAILVFAHDLLMTGLAFTVALWLRVGTPSLAQYLEPLMFGVPVLMAIAAIVYFGVGLYRGIWRYASIPDLVQLGRAVTLTTLLFVLTQFLLTRLDTFPRSLPPLMWFVLLIFLGGPRFLYRLAKDGRLALRDPGLPEIPVLLVGVGDAADLFIRSLGVTAAPYRVVGLIDDKNSRVGHAVRGVPVLGQAQDLAAIVKQLDAKGQRPHRLILTKDQAEFPGPVVRELLDESTRLGLTLARLPSLTELKSGLDAGKIEVRPIALEDLLGRPQTALNRGAIAGLIAGQRVIVTGAGGTIGSELVRQIAALGPSELALVEACEFNLYSIDMEIRERFPDVTVHPELADVRDRDRIHRLFQRHRPALVFHAAALKHVPMVEANLTEGALTNIIGSRNVADAARASGCRAMVLISTDKAIRPTSAMGATKRMAETYCQALDLLPARDGETATRFMTVRFGNVLGSSGSVVPLFTRQLANGGPLTVTHPDMRRYFMTVREAVELVLQASAYGVTKAEDRGKVLVLDMGEPVKIVDLARQMIRLAGHQPDGDVKIVFTGLRPGEKLFEEILSHTEAPTRTEADGVFLAAPRVLDHAFVQRALTDLETAARAGDAVRVLEIIAANVPDYQISEPLQTASAQA
jgi:FlaA1/EpsC-like NDP-sugar epimerase